MLDKEDGPVKDKVYFTFLGTAQHRDTEPNLLTYFHDSVAKYSQTADGKSIAAYLFDGVGCAGSAEHPTPGTYTLVGVDKKQKKIVKDFVSKKIVHNDVFDYSNIADKTSFAESAQISKQLIKFANALTLRRTRYQITGEGVDDLMMEAILFIQNLVNDNKGVIPKEINLNGFSRGADTCVRLAHILQDFFPDSKVNLFLVDPVPGPGRFNNKKSYIIPSNVENCHLIIMGNEHIPVFKPQDLDSYVFASNSTKVKYNILPGNHGSGILRKPGEVVGSDASYKLVQNALLKKNIEHKLLPEGAKINQEIILKNQNYLVQDCEEVEVLDPKQEFAIYCKGLFDFTAKCQRPEVANYYKRNAMLNRSRDVRHAEIFLDEGHRSAFIKAFPNLNAWVFQKDNEKSALALEELITLRKINAIYAAKFIDYIYVNKLMKTRINLAQDNFEDLGKDVYGQEISADTLAYYRTSLRNVVNLFKHNRSLLEKDAKTFAVVKETLERNFSLPADKALLEIETLLEQIKANKEVGVVAREVRKIIYKPDEQIDNFIKMIKEKLDASDLDDTQKQILRRFFGKEISQPVGKFSWDKYVDLRDRAIFAQASLAKLTINNNLASVSLSKDLIAFFSVDYGIPNITDKLIDKLRSYQRWYMLFAYFSKFFGFFNEYQYNKVSEIIENLSKMPQEKKNDLLFIENFVNEKISIIFESTNNYNRAQNYFSKFSFLNKYLLNIFKDFITKSVNDFVAKTAPIPSMRMR